MIDTNGILRSRAVVETDVTDCAAWLIAHERIEPDFHQPLPSVLGELLKASRMQGVLIEQCDASNQCWIPRAIGLSAFVRSDLVDAHLSAPTPFLFVGALAKARRTPEILLHPDEQARANASGGMDLIAHFMQGGWDFSVPVWRTVGSLGHAAYVRDHRGFRINRILQEDWERQPDIYLASGYVRRASFTDGRGGQGGLAPPDPARVLYYADTEIAHSNAPGSSVSYVMQYTPPRCGFTPAEQKLILRALDGQTDQLISDLHNVSLNTIKMHWRKIYEKIAVSCPMVLGVAGEVDDVRGGRGIEKRRRVLAFAEDHPQEMRPYSTQRKV